LGVGAGQHKVYDVICVMDFAAEFEDFLETMSYGKRPEFASYNEESTTLRPQNQSRPQNQAMPQNPQFFNNSQESVY